MCCTQEISARLVAVSYHSVVTLVSVSMHYVKYGVCCDRCVQVSDMVLQAQTFETDIVCYPRFLSSCSLYFSVLRMLSSLIVDC